MEDQEIVTEFLIESSENLSRLDQEMVELEKRPGDAGLLASIFRTIHTIKGTCGFLGFTALESISHHAENLLSLLRNGELELTPARVSLILETVDATRRELVSIESGGKESGADYAALRERLRVAAMTQNTAVPAAAPPPFAAPIQPETPPDAGTADAPASSDGLGPRNPAAADSTIRVDVSLLDKLMNLVGELVLARNQILQFSVRQEHVQLTATSQRLNLITTQLQEGVMKTRMQPIGMVWNKLPRVVRDLAGLCGKQIGIEMDGADTELDKSIIEAIKDPLTHIVRNCCDHGIERPELRVARGKSAQGKLLLRAFHEGGQVNIEIIDDGGGIDLAKVKAKAIARGLIRSEQSEAMSDREAANLVFLPGFSTADEVTNISGRGVGMDVVKTNIEKIGGSVDLVSRPLQGTTVKLKIPLTLAIIPGLVVRSGDQRFVIPQVSLLELLRLEGEAGLQQIERIQGAPVYRRRGTLLPLAYLNQVLRLPPPAAPLSDSVVNIVVLQAEDRQFGLVVDGVNDTQEIVVKPLGKQLKGMNCYAGATIMGDGKVALILDVVGLAQRSGVIGEGHGGGRIAEAVSDNSDFERQSLLLFRAGSHERLAVPLSLVARLEEFSPERIERANGRGVVQYRGQILPLVPLGPMLDPGAASSLDSGEPVPVVVYGDGERAVGIVVDQILDIIEAEVLVSRKAGPGLLFGSAVLGGKITDFIDLPMVVGASGEDPFEAADSRRKQLSVLVATGSGVSRGMARAYLEMAGHRVREATSAVDAIRSMGRRRYDAVFVGSDLPGTGAEGGAAELLGHIRSTPAYHNVPVIGMTGEPRSEAPGGSGYDAWQSGLDRDSMLTSLERLAGSVASARAGERNLMPAGQA
jgi:two-component system, chemotaxis family, sensor kinase CheA